MGGNVWWVLGILVLGIAAIVWFFNRRPH
jgi:hypothetical protein